ncbi:MAG: prepilin peptidase [Verrucomicrobia bacterium]|nr:prepilin peptidase [Verrucomicrobiota bacterium]
MLENFEILNAEAGWFFPLLAFVFGAVVGSFLNVCIYRIPQERSVVHPRSSCACGALIAWYHNIPILSWLFLRGRAACCGGSFSPRYPMVELLTGLFFLANWILFSPLLAVVGMLFAALLILATFIDLDHMIIPDRCSIGGMVLGVVISFLLPELHGHEAISLAAHLESGLNAIVGAIVGAGLVYWIAVLGEVVFRKPAMGEGDVKFLGCIGAFCGWQGAVFGMFGGALIGSVVLLPILLLGRIFGWEQTVLGEDGSPVEEKVAFGSQVPFGPMLAGAGLLYFLILSPQVDAYLADFVTLLRTF